MLPQPTTRKIRPNGNRPNFFIIGAPRCGTSALADYLAAHPQIFMAQKEMHFFGRDLKFTANFYRRDKQEYLAAFNGWNGQHRIGEASVWYLFSKQAAAEIKAFNPDARIIIMVRNPAEMLHSLYYAFRADRNEPLATFREALAAQDERRAGRRVSRNTYLRQGLIYHDVPRYTEQIRRYFKIFGRERVQVVTYDDFAAQTDKVFAGVLDFLGLDSTWQGKKFPVINGNHSLKIPWLQTIMGDPLIRGTAIAMRSWLPGPVFSTLKKTENLLKKLNCRHHKRSQLDSDLCRKLNHEFTPEVERLGKLLGRDLTHWNQITPSLAAQPVKFDVVSRREAHAGSVSKHPLKPRGASAELGFHSARHYNFHERRFSGKPQMNDFVWNCMFPKACRPRKNENPLVEIGFHNRAHFSQPKADFKPV